MSAEAAAGVEGCERRGNGLSASTEGEVGVFITAGALSYLSSC
jgi:hypothetical protein